MREKYEAWMTPAQNGTIPTVSIRVITVQGIEMCAAQMMELTLEETLAGLRSCLDDPTNFDRLELYSAAARQYAIFGRSKAKTPEA